MGRRIASVAFWAFIVVTSILLFPIAVLIFAATYFFDPRLRALHQFTCFWASLYTWLNPLWRVHVDHRDRIDPDQTYVMVANHLSLLDILVLFRLFTNFAWVSKIENFSVPVIGWNMRMNGYIPLVRGDKESAVEMMERCRTTLREGTSIMMFPEGTRSRDGQLQDFKPGAFQLALETELPILPDRHQRHRQCPPQAWLRPAGQARHRDHGARSDPLRGVRGGGRHRRGQAGA